MTVAFGSFVKRRTTNIQADPKLTFPLSFRSEHLYEPVEKRIVNDEKATAPPSPPSPRIAEEVVHREIQKAAASASASSPPPKPPFPSAKGKGDEGEEARDKTPSPKEPPKSQPLKARSRNKNRGEDAGGDSIPPSKTASPTPPAKDPVFLTQQEEPPSRTTTGMDSRSGARWDKNGLVCSVFKLAAEEF